MSKVFGQSEGKQTWVIALRGMLSGIPRRFSRSEVEISRQRGSEVEKRAQK